VTTEYQPTLSKPIRIEPVNFPVISRTIGLLGPSWWLAGACPIYQDSQHVERLIDHQILGVHHVRDDLGGQLSWDIGF
jgi:hypothetical protein